MQVLSVGELYHPGRTSWPEVVDYNYRAGGHELRVFYRSPSPVEVEDFAAGDARFALAVSGDVIFLCFRFGTQPWSDGTFSWWLVNEEERQLPELWPEPEARAMLSVVFVDAATGIVRALRVMTFSPEFTRKLHKAIHEQAARPWPGMDAYMAQATRVYTRYPSNRIANDLAIAKCKGGD